MKVKSEKLKVKSLKDFTIAVVGSHSALDVCRGAKDEGFKTLVIVEKGRDKTYARYFKTEGRPSTYSTSSAQANSGPTGCVDEVLYVEKFKDILKPDVQKKLLSKNCIFIPHRSFEVYLNNYDGIENDFKVPMFGNRKLLRIEERTEQINQYDVLEKTGIKRPKIFKDPKDIDRLVIIKVAEKERGFERGFFLASSQSTYTAKSKKLLRENRISDKALEQAVIEEFILGVQVNFNFFYSPVSKRLELVGTDTRRQTDIEGFLKLPAEDQLSVKVPQKYEEAGHIATTVLESLLEPAFEMGEKFVKATKEMYPPGIIGPFSLQSAITPGPPKKEIVVFDVSPRMPGSPGIFATPYSGYLYGHSISMGRRVAMEIRNAITKNKLEKVIT